MLSKLEDSNSLGIIFYPKNVLDSIYELLIVQRLWFWALNP